MKRIYLIEWIAMPLLYENFSPSYDYVSKFDARLEKVKSILRYTRSKAE